LRRSPNPVSKWRHAEQRPVRVPTECDQEPEVRSDDSEQHEPGALLQEEPRKRAETAVQEAVLGVQRAQSVAAGGAYTTRLSTG
jgi:hypothetical protein